MTAKGSVPKATKNYKKEHPKSDDL
jgi:hypothetical protein